MSRTPFVSRSIVLLMALSLVSLGCASPPKPAVCATVGAVLGGGAGYEIDDTDRWAGASAGGILLGSAGYFICRAMAEEEAPAPAPEPAPAPAAQPAPAPAPAPTEVAERIVLRGVNFDFDQSTIRPDAAVILDEAARILKGRDDVQVAVAGHTDWTGTDDYNQGLSERRAASVRDYLVGQGVAAGRLSTRGYGESQPVASNETREGRALNRRVELNVLE